MKTLFIDIILPIPIPQLFTYNVPESFLPDIKIGKRVIVPFGRKKFYSGIITYIHNNEPTAYQTKEIISVLDESPVVCESQIKFWFWMAEYYQCSIGEVYKAALPSGLKLESETRVSINESSNIEIKLKEKELLVLDYIKSKKNCSISDIQKNCDINQPLLIINKLINHELIYINEELKQNYKPKYKTIIKPGVKINNETKLKNVFNELNKAPKQLDTLMAFISIVGFKKLFSDGAIDKTVLVEKCGNKTTALNELIKKEILIQEHEEVDRLNNKTIITKDVKSLSIEQSLALNSIKNQLTEKNTVLLHGVTSSGKTEIYIHLIQEQIDKGNQVLYLLPEIALTTQITSRLKQHFGNKLGIYHSKYSDSERVELWQNLLKKNDYMIILGARSSIFLPFTKLSLIIVDEEHETSYKQYDPAPRYHARDAAIVLAGIHKAKVILGTATPSIESYYNSQTGKYGLTTLKSRHQGIQLPEIRIANIREAKRKKQMQSHFTPLLIEQIKLALDNNEQIILFQNRRGFAPYIECKECATIPKCKNCDVSMTYHKKSNHLTCHYCGYSMSLPNTCIACGAPALETRGFGTEKIEEEIKLFFPEAKIGRMDIDTARTKKAHEKIIHEFENNHIDILIGTQMISKGLHFDNVSLVGILDADLMLNFPDFRAFERSFQLLSQVSGRAGRKSKRGTVILQTTDPNHPVIQQVVQNNFDLLYSQQIEERNIFKYPPFYRLININVKHKNDIVAKKASHNLSLALKSIFGNRVLGPQSPIISKIQNLHIQQILIKIERKASPAKSKEYIQSAINSLLAQPTYRSVIIQIDVDPQ
ncbi:MAG: primosomal protein N' [Marinilabiliaceae bacterium]|nr:primosomal protein N' [Marinilabiliaceae bacterium]